jgi:hypothetical protein
MATLIQRILIVLSLALYTLPSFAQSSAGSGGAWGFAGRKAEVKRQSRWSLDEWLATRDRMRWSDMWLAMNSPSPYEFFVSGAANLTSMDDHSKFQMKYALGAYASIVGLEFDHENIVGEAYNARLNLRVMGYNVQNTNLTLFGGLRWRTENDGFRQPYLGASLTLYLRKFFGVYGQYRSYLASTPGSVHGNLTGSRWEAGPFIDFGPLRVFGNYVHESESGDNGYSDVGKGWILGGQLFF